MVEIYLPETDEREFAVWLHSYCGQKIASNAVYEFSKGWNYTLYYPALGDQTRVSFTARVYRAFYRPGGNETTETMANNLEAIKLEWHAEGDGLKLTVLPHHGAWVTPPLQDLLTSIRDNWPQAVSDDWTEIP